MRNYFLLTLGHILDSYGFIFCELAFKASDVMDRCFTYNDETDRYNGFFGYIFDRLWSWVYKTGCWFYDRAWKLCWTKIDEKYSPWKKVQDPQGKIIHVKKKGIDAIR